MHAPSPIHALWWTLGIVGVAAFVAFVIWAVRAPKERPEEPSDIGEGVLQIILLFILGWMWWC